MQSPRAAGCPVAGADGPDRGTGSHPCAFRGVADAKNPRNVYLAVPLRGSAARDRGRRGFRAHETAGFWKRALHPGARRLPRGIHNPVFLHLVGVKPSGVIRLAFGTVPFVKPLHDLQMVDAVRHRGAYVSREPSSGVTSSVRQLVDLGSSPGIRASRAREVCGHAHGGEGRGAAPEHVAHETSPAAGLACGRGWEGHRWRLDDP